jgi:hypothetical protein
VIRADRELLANLVRMNSDVVPLATRIMDDSATLDEQQTFADRLIELGTRLNHRTRQTQLIIDGDISTGGSEESRREP